RLPVRQLPRHDPQRRAGGGRCPAGRRERGGKRPRGRRRGGERSAGGRRTDLLFVPLREGDQRRGDAGPRRAVRHEGGGVAFDVGPFWSFLYGLCVFGIADGIPDWLDIRERYKQFKAEAGCADLVPFLKLIGDPDRYCFDAAGSIVRWGHEEPERRDREAATFSELLMREIRDLEGRKERKLRGGTA